MSEVQVIGASYGRTGTMSLYTALAQLGYKPHHMVEVMKKHDLSTWATLGNMLTKAHKANKAADSLEFDKVLCDALKGYTATTDFPSCQYYKELLRLNPTAKVVLCDRDAVKWHESCLETIMAFAPAIRNTWVLKYIPLARYMTETMIDVWIKPTFGTEENALNQEYAVKVFNEHVAEVKRFVPADQLLVFSPKDGWSKLAPFLGKPIPDGPYPNVNDREEFIQRIHMVKYVDYALVAALASIFFGVVAAATSYKDVIALVF